jgi:sulfur transfer protein SufE
VRQDQECQDVLGVYVRRDGERVRVAAQAGEESTTLTRALSALLAEHLNGESPRAILELDASIVPRVVGDVLMRQRGTAAFYTLRRFKEAVQRLELTPAS